MPKKQTVAVLGAGNMGTSIANVIAQNGFIVNLWNYEGDPEPLKQIAEFGENKKYLTGIMLSKNIKPVFDLAEALKNIDEPRIIHSIVDILLRDGEIKSYMALA